MHYKIKHIIEEPFTVYADFESIRKQLSGDGNKCQEHIACSYAYQIDSSVPRVEFEPRLHVGVGAVDHFLNTLQEDFNKYLMPLIGVDMIWNDEAKEKFESATHCHVCKKQLEVIKCEIIVISLDNFVELYTVNAT